MLRLLYFTRSPGLKSHRCYADGLLHGLGSVTRSVLPLLLHRTGFLRIGRICQENMTWQNMVIQNFLNYLTILNWECHILGVYPVYNPPTFWLHDYTSHCIKLHDLNYSVFTWQATENMIQEFVGIVRTIITIRIRCRLCHCTKKRFKKQEKTIDYLSILW